MEKCKWRTGQIGVFELQALLVILLAGRLICGQLSSPPRNALQLLGLEILV